MSETKALDKLVDGKYWHQGTRGEQVFISPDITGGDGWLYRAVAELAQLHVELDEARKAIKEIKGALAHGRNVGENFTFAYIAAEDVADGYLSAHPEEVVADTMITCSKCGKYHSVYLPCPEVKK